MQTLIPTLAKRSLRKTGCRRKSALDYQKVSSLFLLKNLAAQAGVEPTITGLRYGRRSNSATVHYLVRPVGLEPTASTL